MSLWMEYARVISFPAFAVRTRNDTDYRTYTLYPVLYVSHLQNADSVEQALAQFTSFETLAGPNSYKCERCKCFVQALKRFTIHRPPIVLTLHLKRCVLPSICRCPIYVERLLFDPAYSYYSIVLAFFARIRFRYQTIII